MRCESVPDTKIEHPRDAIIRGTSCANCGSDLHIFDGVAPFWLWTSIVDLVGAHERAYLDHCRRFALDASEPRRA